METWDYGEGKAALYSEDPAVWEAARKAGLKQVGEYRRKDGASSRYAAWPKPPGRGARKRRRPSKGPASTPALRR